MSLSDSNTPRTLRPTNPFCAAVLIAVAVLFSAGCNKNTARIPVHPVVGTIQFRGQPAEGAFVSLYPKSAIEGVPNPRGTVSKDGSFVVSTYDGNDGAPEGEYVVTVQWYKPVRQGNDLVGGPNVIPPKFASPRTSNVTVRIAAGENRLPSIKL